jgi:hypothetical protein
MKVEKNIRNNYIKSSKDPREGEREMRVKN